MTVKELVGILSKFDQNEQVIVYSENKDGFSLFEITGATQSKGTPHRDDNGEVHYCFDANGQCDWVFIEVETP